MGSILKLLGDLRKWEVFLVIQATDSLPPVSVSAVNLHHILYSTYMYKIYIARLF